MIGLWWRSPYMSIDLEHCERRFLWPDGNLPPLLCPIYACDTRGLHVVTKSFGKVFRP